MQLHFCTQKSIPSTPLCKKTLRRLGPGFRVQNYFMEEKFLLNGFHSLPCNGLLTPDNYEKPWLGRQIHCLLAFIAEFYLCTVFPAWSRVCCITPDSFRFTVRVTAIILWQSVIWKHGWAVSGMTVRWLTIPALTGSPTRKCWQCPYILLSQLCCLAHSWNQNATGTHIW